MKKIIMHFIFSFMAVFYSGVVAAQAFKTVTVSYIVDGDTFATKGGERVRLLHINTPEMGYGKKIEQPFAKKAKQKLTALIKGKNVTLRFGGRKTDKYKRLLAHVYLNDVWVNKQMIETGLAHVYTFPDNRKNIMPLIKAENKARALQKGIWKHKRWQIIKADSFFGDDKIGQFNLVEGVVGNVAKVRNKIYLNFGENWKTDFTVEIDSKYKDNFKEIGGSIIDFYKGKKLLIRGVIKPVNGALVTATHPEQLEIMM